MLQGSVGAFCVARGSNGDGGDVSAGICWIAGGEVVIGVIAELMLDGVAGRAGKDHLPGPPSVAAAPESGVACKYNLRVRAIEGKDIDAAAKIEHAPRLAIVARDVTAGHVAMLNH